MSGDTVDVGTDSDPLTELRDENDVEDFELFEDAADEMEFDELGFDPVEEQGPNTREAFEDEEGREEDDVLWEET